MKTAIVIGSTGLIGSALVQLLLESSDYSKVITFVKRDAGLQHPKLVQHQIDFDATESFQQYIVGDDLFCTIGTTIKNAGSQEAFRKVDFEYPKQFASIAVAQNVKQFLLISSLNASATSTNFYLKTKGEIQDFLKTLPFENVAILQPSLLLGPRTEFRFGEKVGAFFMKIFSFVFQGNLKKYKAIQGATVAKAMYTLAQKNTQGFHIYESDVLEELGK